MKCNFCKNELYEGEFFSLIKYRDPEKLEGMEIRDDFCNEECINKFKELGENDYTGYHIYRISRCAAYNDCLNLNNLRNKCEDIELGKPKPATITRSPILGIPDVHIPMPKMRFFCNPAEAGIVMATAKLMNLLDKFDKKYQESSNEMLEHSKNMNRLTKLILLFTLVNLVFLIVSIFK